MRKLGVVATSLLALSNLAGLIGSSAQAVARPADAAKRHVMVSREVHHDVSPPLRNMTPSTTPGRSHPALRVHGAPQKVVRSKDTSGTVANPRIPSPIANFDGIAANGSAPPDTQGAAGTTQYFEMANTEIAVYSKTGSIILAPEKTNTLWSGFGGGCQTNNDGDGVVLWDTIAQRWVISQFSVSTTPYLECVAVSATTDATGSYYRYSFSYSSFPDYPKMGVWPDAYYVSLNLFNAGGTQALGTELCAYNRSAMLTGAAATQQCFMGYTSGEHTQLPGSLDGTRQPSTGENEYFVGLSSTANNLAYFKFHVDWATPSNSTLTGPTNLGVTAFSQACGGGTCIPQSGTTQQLDSLGDRVMARLAYRNLGTAESLVVNHAVTSGSSVGERWYELRVSGGNLTVYQQGTDAPDSSYRWMGSIASDQSGDISLGYSVSSSSLHPGVRYTGRLPGDPLGTMPQGEGTVFTGAGSQTGGLSRWGDYSAMSIDPADDCTFWYTNEYIPSNGSFNWHTRIASYKFSTCGTPPPNDFSISANPSSITLTQGQSGTSTISTVITSGSSQSVTLSASGLPSGATASFNPNPINSGSSSTLTITTASTTPPGTYTVTVTGTGTYATHSTTITLTVNPSGGGSVVVNGGFETGDFTGWTRSGVLLPTIQSGGAHTGTYSAKLGSSVPFNGDSILQQTITVPSAGGTLVFWYNPHCPDTIQYDQQQAQIRSTGGSILATVMNVCSNSAVWTQVSYSLNPWAGQTVVLWFNAHDDNYPSDPTYTLFDDVSLQ